MKKNIFLIILGVFLFSSARNNIYAQNSPSCGFNRGVCCRTEPRCQNSNYECRGLTCEPKGGTTPLPTIIPDRGGAINFDDLEKNFPGVKRQFLPSSTESVGGIINIILPYLFVIAGLILLFMLIYGGFHMMVAANDPKGLQEARGKITNALVGFLLLFVSYWLVQIIEVIFGVQFF